MELHELTAVGLVHPVASALQDIMVDEQWHLKWVKDQLKALEKRYGKKAVAETVERYREVDERVYAEVAPVKNEPWKISGKDQPRRLDFVSETDDSGSPSPATPRTSGTLAPHFDRCIRGSS